jgi:Cu/Ag efflux protein CusF
MRPTTLAAISFLALSAMTSPQNALAQSDMIAGQVTKIDESAGKMTIKHGPIPKFELDEGHTMVFRVQDPAMLKAVKAGDKIKFEADRVNGQFTVMKIEEAK